MKSLLLIPILVLTSLPAEARHRRYHHHANRCYEEVYREDYLPGTVYRQGRVRSYMHRVEVPCRPAPRARGHYHEPPVRGSYDTDDNSCIEGSIIGGIAGGAAGGTLATQENWIWSIPTGILGGVLLGCQLDGA